MIELSIALATILITAFLGLIAYLGKKAVDKIDLIHEKVIKIVDIVYDEDGADRIRRLEVDIRELNTTIFDINGTNGIMRKLRRLEINRRSNYRINQQLCRVMNEMIDKAGLNIEKVDLYNQD